MHAGRQQLRYDGTQLVQSRLLRILSGLLTDKDPALKALMRCLDKAHSAETSTLALRDLKSALASRGLLPAP